MDFHLSTLNLKKVQRSKITAQIKPSPKAKRNTLKNLTPSAFNANLLDLPSIL